MIFSQNRQKPVISQAEVQSHHNIVNRKVKCYHKSNIITAEFSLPFRGFGPSQRVWYAHTLHFHHREYIAYIKSNQRAWKFNNYNRLHLSM